MRLRVKMEAEQIVRAHREAERRKTDAEGVRQAHLDQIKFQVGDIVLLYHPQVPKGVSSKLSTHWKGPYQIMEQTGPLNYKIRAEGRISALYKAIVGGITYFPRKTSISPEKHRRVTDAGLGHFSALPHGLRASDGHCSTSISEVAIKSRSLCWPSGCAASEAPRPFHLFLEILNEPSISFLVRSIHEHCHEVSAGKSPTLYLLTCLRFPCSTSMSQVAIKSRTLGCLTCLRCPCSTSISQIAIKSRTLVTDAALAHLSALLLQQLNLTDCNQVTDAGLAHLSAAPAAPQSHILQASH
eukprot:g54206.t1